MTAVVYMGERRSNGGSWSSFLFCVKVVRTSRNEGVVGVLHSAVMVVFILIEFRRERWTKEGRRGS